MKKKNRLKTNLEFTSTINSNKLKKSPSYVVFAKKNDLGYLRVGISTSKKLGKAVVRVKIRRQIRAFIASYNRYELPYDVVVIVKNGYLKQTNKQNKEELIEMINKLISNKGGDK